MAIPIIYSVRFRRHVLDFFKRNGRKTLPWRKTKNPYRILVSEIMLQQTQVDRVIPKYKAFLKKFPTVGALAHTPLSEVLREWQGLGYNRRAKMLHEAAKVIVEKHGGKVPLLYNELVELPGIGDYTAKAVRVFAWNEPEVLIETNVRTVMLHHFFKNGHLVDDKKLLPIIEKTLDSTNPREWYAALMDYGSHLKKTMPNPSRKSAHHTKQKPFKGSDREIRGAILRFLSKKSSTLKEIHTLPFEKRRVNAQLASLLKEKLVARKTSHYTLGN